MHIPPGVTNGWIKIETLEGLYTVLEEQLAQRPRLVLRTAGRS